MATFSRRQSFSSSPNCQKRGEKVRPGHAEVRPGHAEVHTQRQIQDRTVWKYVRFLPLACSWQKKAQSELCLDLGICPPCWPPPRWRQLTAAEPRCSSTAVCTERWLLRHQAYIQPEEKKKKKREQRECNRCSLTDTERHRFLMYSTLMSSESSLWMIAASVWLLTPPCSTDSSAGTWEETGKRNKNKNTIWVLKN